MRILAHYTVFDSKVFNLHVFDIAGRNISHFPVEVETAHTLFLQGILIVGNEHISEQQLEHMHRIILQSPELPLKELADKLCDYMTTENLHCPEASTPKLLKVTFPYQKIAILK